METIRWGTFRLFLLCRLRDVTETDHPTHPLEITSILAGFNRHDRHVEKALSTHLLRLRLLLLVVLDPAESCRLRTDESEFQPQCFTNLQSATEMVTGDLP
jgi:hypothetical protein